jgi:murein DD-endopeptidase MepM/ murein hydrolase activator NlpD
MRFSRLKTALVALSLMVLMITATAPPLYAQPSGASDGVLRNAYLLVRLQNYLESANQSFSSLQSKIDDTRSEIEENRDKISTLEGQLQHLEILMEESTHKIRNVEEQIQVKEQDIASLMEAIEFNEVQRLDQENTLLKTLRLLYFEKNIYFGQTNQLNSFKLFLQGNTLSTALQEGTYIRILEQQTEATMTQLNSIEFNIRAAKVELVSKRQQLGLLRLQLDGEERNLAAEYQGKKNLLDTTLNSDEIYRELFASYKLAQDVILGEINLFRTNMDVLDQRISLIAPQLSSYDLEQLDAIRDESNRNFGVATASSFLDLAWPVLPSLGLSAFFDDSGYVATFGVAHHALDIPVAHHSIFSSPADGVVYKVKDTASLDDPLERLGYGYMIVAHRKGVMTLYGHIGASLVREGDFVKKGQILGLTGGTPGTPGAGARTTGAHLHLEVFQDGIRVDPLEYLPLDYIPESKWQKIPEKYLLMMQQKLANALEAEGIDDVELDDLKEAGLLEYTPPLIVDIKQTLENSVPEETSEEEDEDAPTENDFWEQGE